MEFVQTLLDSNPYFSAGAGLAGLGVALATGRKAWQTALMIGRRQLLVSLEVTSKDRAYPWVLQWLNRSSQRTQHLSVQTTSRLQVNGATTTEFVFQPSPGRHLFRLGTRPVLVQRQREEQMLDLTTGMPFETVTLTAPGRDVGIFKTFLEEAERRATEEREGMTTIYTAWGADWRPFGHPRRRRPLDSVILDEGVGEAMLADLRDFLGNAAWYTKRGIPYRRGYLLHGPPGCGKSSFIMALAGELDYGICILNLNDRGMTDDRLAHALSQVPQQCIVLLEDIDAAFADTESRQVHYDNNVTFSGLLNTLDGVASAEERIVFMTTNHVERLDPALIRPGRVDYIQCVDLATPWQAGKLFDTFYAAPRLADADPLAVLHDVDDVDDAIITAPPPPSTDPQVASIREQFLEQIHGMPLSMARLQGMMMRHKNSPHTFISELPQMLEEREQVHALAASTPAPGGVQH